MFDVWSIVENTFFSSYSKRSIIHFRLNIFCSKMSIPSEVSTFTAQPVSADFTNISLESEPQKKKKIPRRLIHFSDGVLEEYSTDEEEDQPPPQPLVDPQTLTWGPWVWYYVSTVAWKTFSVADTCGEKLAWFFGITTPKYQSAIDEYYRLKAEEEKELEQERKLQERMAGLSSVHVKDLSSEDVKVIDPTRDKGTGPDDKF